MAWRNVFDSITVPLSDLIDAFMLEMLKLSKTLKSSWDNFNILDNFNVSSIKTANVKKVNTHAINVFCGVENEEEE